MPITSCCILRMLCTQTDSSSLLPDISVCLLFPRLDPDMTKEHHTWNLIDNGAHPTPSLSNVHTISRQRNYLHTPPLNTNPQNT